MKVIITGGAGFIGSNLVNYFLENGHEVVVVDNLSTGRLSNLFDACGNQNFKYYCDELANGYVIEKEYWKDCDVVLHHSSIADVLPSIENPTKYFQASVVGTHNVLEAMRKWGIKNIIYAASSSCYGDNDILPTPENMTAMSYTTRHYTKFFDVQLASEKPFLAPYGTYKWMAEREIEFYCKQYGIRCVSFRYFNVYGNRMAKSSINSGAYGIVVAIFLAQYFQNYPLTKIGTGENGRDLIYIDDVCKLNLWAAQLLLSGRHKGYDHFNVGTGEVTTINKLISIINNGEQVISLPARSNEAKYTWADTTKLKSYYESTTGENLEFTTIEDGISILKKKYKDYFSKCSFPKYEDLIKTINTDATT